MLTGEVTPYGEPSLDNVYSHPRVSPSGKVAYVQHARGRWQLNLPVTGSHVVTPEWSGESIVATVFAGGFADIHSFANATDQPLTRAHGGAFEPAPAHDGRIFFMSLDPDGYLVRVLNEPKALPTTLLTDHDLAPALPPVPAPPVMLESRSVSEPRAYGTGRQELAG